MKNYEKIQKIMKNCTKLHEIMQNYIKLHKFTKNHIKLHKITQIKQKQIYFSLTSFQLKLIFTFLVTKIAENYTGAYNLKLFVAVKC